MRQVWWSSMSPRLLPGGGSHGMQGPVQRASGASRDAGHACRWTTLAADRGHGRVLP